MITFDIFWKEWRRVIPKRRSSDSRAAAEKKWFQLSREDRERCFASIPLYRQELIDTEWLQAVGCAVYINQKRFEGLLEDEALVQAEKDEAARAFRARRIERAPSRARLLRESTSTPKFLNLEDIRWLLEEGYIDAETAARHGVQAQLRRVK